MTTKTSVPRLQIAQVLADLSDLNVAEPDAALALVTAHRHLHLFQQQKRAESKSKIASLPDASRFDKRSPRQRPSGMSLSFTPRSSISRGDSSSSVASAPASKKGTQSPVSENSFKQTDPNLERASTLMHLYEVKGQLNQRENVGLARARTNVQAVAERYGMTKMGATS